MSEQSVAELVEMLYKSNNEAWQDDAAQGLAFVSNHSEAEAALFDAIESPALDASLRRTCAESLATLWVNQGQYHAQALEKLHGMPREVVVAFLFAAGIDLKVNRPDTHSR